MNQSVVVFPLFRLFVIGMPSSIGRNPKRTVFPQLVAEGGAASHIKGRATVSRAQLTMQLNKQLFLGIACLAVAFATPQNGTFPSPFPLLHPSLLYLYFHLKRKARARSVVSTSLQWSELPRYPATSPGQVSPVSVLSYPLIWSATFEMSHPWLYSRPSASCSTRPCSGARCRCSWYVSVFLLILSPLTRTS